MMHAVWLVIKAYLLQETNDKAVVLYHDNDICVPTVKHGVFVTPDKRIQLATIERDRGTFISLNAQLPILESTSPSYTRYLVPLLE
jgi:hypothetical protein